MSTNFMLGTSGARTAPREFTQIETILPFALQHKRVANPAWAAWNAAPSNPCSGPDPHCLARRLNVYAYTRDHPKVLV
jgi:hypothetical protein